jgi:hypothetical protein
MIAMKFAVHAGPSQGWQREEIASAGLFVENGGHNCDHYRLSMSFDDPRAAGKREYTLRIDPDTFKALAIAMIRTDRDEAIKAFGAALQADPVPIEQHKRWSPLWAA